MAEFEEQADVGGGVLFLIDPEWLPTGPGETPPETALIGAWRLAEDGTRGRFQPNPQYVPATPDSPLDPVDAVLGKIAAGELAPEALPEVLGDALFGIALDDAEDAIVARAPDGVPSVLVTSSFGHRDRVGATYWAAVTLPELAAALPERGIDVWINPGAANSMRVLADAVRSAAAGSGSTRPSLDPQ